jgi:hypothetical protein
VNPDIAQPLTITQLLDEALKASRRHFRRLYLPVAIPVALASALLPLAQVVFFRQVGHLGPGTAPDFAHMAPGMIGFALAVLLAVSLMILGNGALMVGAVHAAAGRDVPMADAWRTMLRGRILATLLLASIVTFLGFLLCVIPGIYAFLLLSPLIAVMVEEQVFGWAALRRSRELMRYRPKRSFAGDPSSRAFVVLFVGALLGYALAFLVQLPLFAAQQILVFRNIGTGSRMDPAEMMTLMAWISVPSQMLGTLVQTGVHLYTSFGIVLLYFDVRRQKEGADLETAIRSLSPPGDMPPESTDAR